MLDMKFLRENPEIVKENIKKKKKRTTARQRESIPKRKMKKSINYP